MAIARPRPLFFPSRRVSAFTLLEVLVAVAIFSVCVTALYNGFRVSSLAFASGRRSAENLQTIRFVMDQITRDLRGVRFEENYERPFLILEAAILKNQEQIIRDQQAGNPVRLPGVFEAASDDENGTFVGLKGNFRFLGEDKGKTDSIEFTRRMPAEGDFDDAFLGVERVRYFVANNNLYRRRGRAFQVMLLNPSLWEDLVKAGEAAEGARDAAREQGQPFLDYWQLRVQGSLPPQIEPPFPIKFFEEAPAQPQPPELIARNVVEFDLSYGRYAGGSWGETQTWDSDSKQNRSPEFRIPPNDPSFTTKLAAYQRRSNDNLPMYARVRIKVDSGLEEKQNRKKRQNRAAGAECMVWIPAALETYMPRDEGYFDPSSPENAGSGFQTKLNL